PGRPAEHEHLVTRAGPTVDPDPNRRLPVPGPSDRAIRADDVLGVRQVVDVGFLETLAAVDAEAEAVVPAPVVAGAVHRPAPLHGLGHDLVGAAIGARPHRPRAPEPAGARVEVDVEGGVDDRDLASVGPLHDAV